MRRLQTTLTARGEGARRVELTLFRTDGAVKRIAAGTSRPVRDPQAIRALFVERLAALGDEIDPGFGFDLARLSVLHAEPCPEEQIGLGGGDAQADLDRLVDRLSARLGRRGCRGSSPTTVTFRKLAASAAPAQATARAELGWNAVRRFRSETGQVARPCRSLARPEPIEDVVALVPDGPPVRFRWRRVLHEVVAAEGPERIEGAWWSEHDGPARDYFRVEDAKGLRFWLFRSGLYREIAQARQSTQAPRPRDSEPASRCRAGSCTGCMHDAYPEREARRDYVMPRYVEFAAASNFSFLRGASHPEELMLQASALGLCGLGLCDRNSVAGVVRAHLIKREQKLALAYHPGVRLVFADGTPDILAYPRDRAGWGRLCRLLTRGNLRARKGQCILLLDDLIDAHRRPRTDRDGALDVGAG